VNLAEFNTKNAAFIIINRRQELSPLSEKFRRMVTLCKQNPKIKMQDKNILFILRFAF
jgi:hypothetical protein